MHTRSPISRRGLILLFSCVDLGILDTNGPMTYFTERHFILLKIYYVTFLPSNVLNQLERLLFILLCCILTLSQMVPIIFKPTAILFKILVCSLWSPVAITSSHDPTLHTLLFCFDSETPSSKNYMLCI